MLLHSENQLKYSSPSRASLSEEGDVSLASRRLARGPNKPLYSFHVPNTEKRL